MILGFWNLWLLKIRFVSFSYSPSNRCRFFLRCPKMIPPLFIPQLNFSIINRDHAQKMLLVFDMFGQEFRNCVDTHRACDSTRVLQWRWQALDLARVCNYLHADMSALIEVVSCHLELQQHPCLLPFCYRCPKMHHSKISQIQVCWLLCEAFSAVQFLQS